MIHTDTITATNETAVNRLIDSRDTNREAQADSETTRTIFITAYAHQVVFASEIDAHDWATNIHEQTHPYAIFHVFDVATHKIHLQIESVFRR